MTSNGTSPTPLYREKIPLVQECRQIGKEKVSLSKPGCKFFFIEKESVPPSSTHRTLTNSLSIISIIFSSTFQTRMMPKTLALVRSKYSDKHFWNGPSQLRRPFDQGSISKLFCALFAPNFCASKKLLKSLVQGANTVQNSLWNWPQLKKYGRFWSKTF